MGDVPVYTRDDYLTTTKPFEYLYAHKDNKFELKQLLGVMSAQAQTVGIRNLAALFKAYMETVSGTCMTKEEILVHVDHTLLKAVSAWDEIQTLCEEAIENHTASVCIPPSYVKRVSKAYGDKLNVCTVIGFPLGYNTTETKVYETQKALADGAGEVDMVVNLGDVKNGEFPKITREIEAVKKAAGNHVVKVIIETCYLTEDEKRELCKCVTDGGADYIKTSTGFGTAGARIEDVRLFKRYIGEGVKIKAAGGVKTREDLEQFLEEGCERIGTSSALKLLGGQEAGTY